MKEVCLTGIKPTGNIHLGNYLGAMRPAKELLKSGQYDCFFFIADYHALNSIQKSEDLREGILAVSAAWMAIMGEDLKKCAFYRQSDIPEIFQLSSILSNFTAKGLMNRAHSYKDLVSKNKEAKRDPDHGVNMGLYLYPILMASDILICDSEVVPVGQDQVQHLEMTRDMAQCLNSQYKDKVLKLPRALIQKETGVIQGIDGRKMSKSYENTLPLFESEKKIRKTINRIVTDSTKPDAPKDPETSLIFQYYQLLGNQEQTQNFEDRLKKGMSWGEAKGELADLFLDVFKTPREIYDDLRKNPEKIEETLLEGAQKVHPKAKSVLERVKNKIGL